MGYKNTKGAILDIFFSTRCDSLKLSSSLTESAREISSLCLIDVVYCLLPKINKSKFKSVLISLINFLWFWEEK